MSRLLVQLSGETGNVTQTTVAFSAARKAIEQGYDVTVVLGAGAWPVVVSEGRSLTRRSPLKHQIGAVIAGGGKIRFLGASLPAEALPHWLLGTLQTLTVAELAEMAAAATATLYY